MQQEERRGVVYSIAWAGVGGEHEELSATSFVIISHSLPVARVSLRLFRG